MRGLTRWMPIAVLCLAAPLLAGPAVAQNAAGLEVAAVNGRAIELVMTLDPSVSITDQSQVRATVEIGRMVIPATTSIEMPSTASEDAIPDTAILVLDSSGSMAGARMAAAEQAANTFITAMRPEVRIGVFAFNDRVRRLSAPTLDRASVRAEIDALKPDGDTALYDAIDSAVSSLPMGANARVVVLSDGRDTVSTKTLAALRSTAATAGIPVDVVSIRPDAAELAVLRAIAQATGGTVRTASSSSELTDAFAQASAEFGSRIRMQAVIPDDVNASGQTATATVAIDAEVIEDSVQLPDSAALGAVSTQVSSSSESAALAPSPSMSDTLLPILLGLVVGLCLFLAGYVVIRSRHQRRTQARIEQVLRYRTGAQHTSVTIQRTIGERQPRFARLDAALARVSNTKRTAVRLSAAEFDITPAAWLLLRLATAGVLALIASVLFRNVLLGLLLGVAVTWLVAALVLRLRASSRQRAFADALPDFLMLLASGLRAGLSFTHALESAAEEDRGEVGRQIRRALREVQVGASLDVALMECANRMENEDLRWTVTALAIQREVGGNLSSILDSAAATIKARFELRREVRTLSAEGRLSAYILVALPLGVFAFLAVFRRPYISLLWTEPLGIALLVGLVILMVIGWLWMRSIVRIKV